MKKCLQSIAMSALLPWALLLAAPGCVSMRGRPSAAAHRIGSVPTISSQNLRAMLDSGERVTILDVREENEYLERHIPEAVWFPKSQFDKGAESAERILARIEPETTVVSYCGAGHRSSFVTRKLRERGYDAVNLEGISFWEQKGFPVVRGPKLPTSQEPAIIHVEEAYSHYFLLFDDIAWIDVRDRVSWLKGHVKGATSIPVSELADWADAIPTDKEIVLYCEGTWDGGKCDASMSAGRILIEHGLSPGKIKVFDDGYGAWLKAGYPVHPGRLLRWLRFFRTTDPCDCGGSHAPHATKHSHGH